MPTFRPDIAAMNPYQVGRQLEDVAREHGLDPGDIIKMTANEGPEGPFPGVVDAAAAVLSSSNRYPDNDCWDLGHALAEEMGIAFDNLLFGAGSVALLAELTAATSAGTNNIVYGWPSFIMYRYAATWAGTTYREVPLNDRFALDLEAMALAVDENTRVVIVCNPNNPTGTITPADEITDFIESMREGVLVVVDEAYHEFVSDPRYRSLTPVAVENPSVIVLRTFSKIYSLAAHRVGYAVGHPSTLTELRKAQAPLTVNAVAQAAALASLGQRGELVRRQRENRARRHHLVGALAERDLPMAESHTNFIYFHLGDGALKVVAAMTAQGVLIRAISDGWVRVTIGNDDENKRFLAVLDHALI